MVAEASTFMSHGLTDAIERGRLVGAKFRSFTETLSLTCFATAERFIRLPAVKTITI